MLIKKIARLLAWFKDKLIPKKFLKLKSSLLQEKVLRFLKKSVFSEEISWNNKILGETHIFVSKYKIYLVFSINIFISREIFW